MDEIRPLTSLRGIAAFAVVLQHFSATAQLHAGVWIPSLVPHGYMAVDFFFVLSGFIMAYNYLGRFEAAGLAAFPDFVGRRVARVMPLQAGVLVLLLPAAWISVQALGHNIFFTSDHLAYDFVANLFLLHGIGIGTNLNGPSWSISTEFVAYLAFPLLVAAMFHQRFLVWGAALTAAVGGLVWIAAQRPGFGLDTTAIGVSLVRCLTEFTMGLAAFRLYRDKRRSAWLGRDGVTWAFSAATVLLLLLRLDLPLALLFPFLVVAHARNTGAPARWLSRPLPYFMGVISYSVYLIHGPFRPAALELLRFAHPQPLGFFPALAFAAAGSFAIIPFAWLSYILIERPGRDVMRRLMTRNRAAT